MRHAATSIASEWIGWQQCALWKWFPLHFALQAFGEWYIDADTLEAQTTCGILMSWLFFVTPFCQRLFNKWRAAADIETQSRTFRVWGALYLVVLALSTNNVLLLSMGIDAAREWADKSFHFAQVLFIMTFLFTVALDCSLSSIAHLAPRRDTMLLSVCFTSFVFASLAAVASTKLEMGLLVAPIFHNVALFIKYFLACACAAALVCHLEKRQVELHLQGDAKCDCRCDAPQMHQRVCTPESMIDPSSQ